MPETITVDTTLINIVKSAIEVALVYETATHGKRKLGIAGEAGEVLVCYQLGLKLVLDSRSEGFDAIDKDGLQVQIKTRRSESEGLPRDVGRTSPFSRHKFDYALLALLDHNYKLCEIWRADYSKLKPIIEKEKRRNPSLSSFKHVGELIKPKP
ncbi:MAG: hypothetical protein HW402_367 [Dehalococcoidales bacterium]|nr:hypothetical protein [Dehalococcoidales bacterium]